MTIRPIAVPVFFALLLASLPGLSQQQAPTLLLPDNHILPLDKLDSLIQAWGGKERVLYSHDSTDDKKNVLHLVKATDEQLKKLANLRAKQVTATRDIIGHASPTWKVVDINGNTCSLEDFKGKVVVLNFWFTSCPPCIQEMPHLNDLAATYKDKDVVFIALSFNAQDDIRAFLKKQTFVYRQIANSHSIDSLYHVQLWPTSFVIDRRGVVRSAKNFDANIKTLLSADIDQALAH